jgi:hypothetical protein
MPAKDKYHDNVVNALKKDNWRIIADPYTLLLEKRRLYVDLLAQRDDTEFVLIEVKVFEEVRSPMNYIANAVGQYLLYKAALDLIDDDTPLFLAIPETIYDTLMSESLVAHYIKYTDTKLLIYEPVKEVIVKWIT